ncbi:MAG TPA: flagellar hook assembly protein FlgD [Roseococcus sp.]|nr:flagellar hook assembly protein FlgD [Roseococcus sp.]
MSGTIASIAPNATAASTRPRLNADFNTFLNLLTTQLRNQDPTKAMDAQQMTQQLVQFASVEQQLAVNQNLERLVTLQQGSQVVAAAPLMGRMVEVESDQLSLQGGQAALRLPAAGPARSARIEVQDANGRVLRAAEVPLGAAATTWRWDGRDSQGRPQAEGAYRFAVTGATAAGAPAPVAAGVLARATAVERQDGEVRLKLGALSVEFGKLRGTSEGG